MTKAPKGEWVQIQQTVLTPELRAPSLPEDTKKTPLLLWVKGFLEKEAEIGEEVTVKTVTGRFVTGELVAIQPRYTHDFGVFIPELLKIDMQLKEIMRGEK